MKFVQNSVWGWVHFPFLKTLCNTPHLIDQANHFLCSKPKGFMSTATLKTFISIFYSGFWVYGSVTNSRNSFKIFLWYKNTHTHTQRYTKKHKQRACFSLRMWWNVTDFTLLFMPSPCCLTRDSTMDGGGRGRVQGPFKGTESLQTGWNGPLVHRGEPCVLSLQANKPLVSSPPKSIKRKFWYFLVSRWQKKDDLNKCRGGLNFSFHIYHKLQL